MLELLGGLGSFFTVFLVFNWGGHGDVNWPPWYYLLIGVGACVSLFIFEVLTLLGQRKKMAGYFSLSWFYTYLALSYWAFYKAATFKFVPEQQLMIEFLSSQSFLCFIILTLFTLNLGVAKRQYAMFWGLMLCGLAHAIYLIYGNLFYTTGVEQIGLLGNRSLGASFTVVWLTLIPRWKRYNVWVALIPQRYPDALALFLILIGLVAVLTSQSSISYIALGAAGAAYIFKHAWDRMGRVGATVLALGLLALCFATLGIIDPTEVFSTSLRASNWTVLYTKWLHSSGVIFGLGPGSMQFYLPFWQDKLNLIYNREHTFWLWMHNDWLQLLLEYGVVGFLNFVCLWLVCLKRAWRETSLFASVIAIGAIMVGNYPWHIAATALICTFVLWECITIRVENGNLEAHTRV